MKMSTLTTGYAKPATPLIPKGKTKTTDRGGVAADGIEPAPLPTKTEYVCPMHAQIVRDAPGSCPICGMAL